MPLNQTRITAPVKRAQKQAVQQADRPAHGVVELVPPGGEHLDDDVGQDDEDDGDGAVPVQAVQVKGDCEDAICTRTKLLFLTSNNFF